MLERITPKGKSAAHLMASKHRNQVKGLYWVDQVGDENLRLRKALTVMAGRNGFLACHRFTPNQIQILLSEYSSKLSTYDMRDFGVQIADRKFHINKSRLTAYIRYKYPDGARKVFLEALYDRIGINMDLYGGDNETGKLNPARLHQQAMAALARRRSS